MCSDFIAQSIIQLSTFIPYKSLTMKPLLLKTLDSSSLAIHSLITGKSLTYNRQAFSSTTLTTTISLNHCRIDYVVLISTEHTAPKFLNFVLPVPLVPMVAERCGHSARTAGLSPWSTPTNAFHHATTENEKSISSIRARQQPDWISRPDNINPPDRLCPDLESFLTFFSVLSIFISSLDRPCCPRHRWLDPIDRQLFDIIPTAKSQPRQFYIQAAISHTLTSILPTLPNELFIRRPLNNSQPVPHSPEHKSHSHPSSTDLI